MKPELVELAPGAYAYVQPDGSWMINNAGIVVGDDGSVLLVDTTSTEARNRALLATAEGLGRLRALVNTHHHGDHTFGNWMVDVPIIAHEACREEIINAGLLAANVLTGPDYGRIEVRPPDVTFTESMTVRLGSTVVELHHLGPAHTRGDVIAWLPQQRVLYAGDLAFAGGQPFLAEGSIAGYPKALARIRAFQPSVLVPGHGPVCHEVDKLLDDLEAYTEHVATLAAQGRAAGREPLEVAKTAAPSRFDDWRESERLVGNLHRAYSELDGNPVDARLDVAKVWGDMVKFHGGPIHSHA